MLRSRTEARLPLSPVNDVDGKTNEITCFRPLLDQISDLRDIVITADAPHCQRAHGDYLAERGADWILTVKGNQPHLPRPAHRSALAGRGGGC